MLLLPSSASGLVVLGRADRNDNPSVPRTVCGVDVVLRRFRPNFRRCAAGVDEEPQGDLTATHLRILVATRLGRDSERSLGESQAPNTSLDFKADNSSSVLRWRSWSRTFSSFASASASKAGDLCSHRGVAPVWTSSSSLSAAFGAIMPANAAKSGSRSSSPMCAAIAPGEARDTTTACVCQTTAKRPNAQRCRAMSRRSMSMSPCIEHCAHAQM